MNVSIYLSIIHLSNWLSLQTLNVCFPWSRRALSFNWWWVRAPMLRVCLFVCVYSADLDLLCKNKLYCVSIVCKLSCETESQDVCVSLSRSTFPCWLQRKLPWLLSPSRVESSRSPHTLHQMFSLPFITSPASLSPSPRLVCFYPILMCHLFILWVSPSLPLPGPIAVPLIIGWCTDSQTMSLNHHEHFCLLENIEEYFVCAWLNFPSLCLPYVGDLCMCVPQRDVPEFTQARAPLPADHSRGSVQRKPKLTVLMCAARAFEFRC